MLPVVMPIDLADDPKILREQLEELLEELRATKRELAERDRQLAEIKAKLDAFMNRFFGPRSERFAPDQLAFAFLDEDLYKDLLDKVPPHTDEAPDDEGTSKGKKRKRRRNGRAPIPEDLPREDRVHEPDPDALHCDECDVDKVRIGEEVSEQVEYVPASIKVIRHIRPRYACPCCESGVTIADPPPAPIDKGRPGPGLLAKVVVSKYEDHLPLNRQTRVFGRHGYPIHRSTLCDWVGDTASLLRPIAMAMKREILATGYVNTDDTPVRVHMGKKGPGKTKEGRIWVYASSELREAVYDFTMSRAGAGPESFLGNFTGYLQADAFSGYDRLFESGDIVEVGCMAHARRGFHDARSTEPEGASVVLAVIRGLYMIERAATEAGFGPEERRRVRQIEAAPLLESLEKFLRTEGHRALPKSPFGKAIGYALNQWDAICRYTTDGRLSIDNGLSERCLRSVAVGRNNWVFAGSPAGGERAAVLYSLVQSCRLQGIDAFTYLRDVIARLHVTPMSRIGELTPRGWRLAREASAAQE